MNHARELKKLDAVFSDIVPPMDTRDWEHNKYVKQTKTKFPIITGTMQEVDINSKARGPLVFELDDGGFIELEASCVKINKNNMWCRIEKASEKEINESSAEANSAPSKYPDKVKKRIRKYQSEAYYNRNDAVYWHFLLNIENTSHDMTIDGSKTDVDLYEYLKIAPNLKFPSEVYENDFDIAAFKKYGIKEDTPVEDEHETPVEDGHEYYTEPIFGSGRYRETYIRIQEQIKIIMDNMFTPSTSSGELSGELPPLQKKIKFQEFITKIIGDNTAFIKTASQTCAFIEAEPGDDKSPSITNLLEKQYNDDIWWEYEVPRDYFKDPSKHSKYINKSLYSFEEKKKEFHTVFLNSIVLYTDIMFVLKKYIFDDNKQLFMGSYCTKTQYDELKEVYEFIIDQLLFMSKQCMEKFGLESRFDDSGPQRSRTPTQRGAQMWHGGDRQGWVAGEAIDYWTTLREEVNNLYDNITRGGASISRSDIRAFNQKQNNENFLGERALFSDLDREDVRQILNDDNGIADFRDKLEYLKNCGRDIDTNWPSGTTRTSKTYEAIPQQDQSSWSVKKMGKLLSTVAFSLIGMTYNMYSLNAIVPSNIEDIFMEPYVNTTVANSTGLDSEQVVLQSEKKSHIPSKRTLVLGHIANSVIIKQMAWCTSSFISQHLNIQHWCAENPVEQLKIISKYRRTQNANTESWILQTYVNKPDEKIIKDLKKKLNKKIPYIASKCTTERQQTDLPHLSYDRTSERGRLLDIVKEIQNCVEEYKGETLKRLQKSRAIDRCDEVPQDEAALDYLAAYVYENYLAEHRSQVVMVTEFQWWMMVLFVGQSVTHEGLYSYFQKKLNNVRKQAGLLNPLLLTSINVAALTFKGLSTTLNSTSPGWNLYNVLWFGNVFCKLHGGNKIIQLMIGDDEHVDVSNGQVYIYNDEHSYYSSSRPTNELRFIQQVADTRTELNQNTDPKYINIAFKEFVEWQGKYNLDRVEYLHMPPGTFIKYRPPSEESNPDSSHARIMVIVNSCGAMGAAGSFAIFDDFKLKGMIDENGLTVNAWEHGNGLKRIAFCPFVNEFYEIDCNNYGWVENVKQRQLNAMKLFWNAVSKRNSICSDINDAICQECKVISDICCYPSRKNNFRIPAIIDLLKQDDIFPFRQRDFERSREERSEIGFLIPLQIRAAKEDQSIRAANEVQGEDIKKYTGALWSPIKGFIWVFKGNTPERGRTSVTFCGSQVDGHFIIKKEAKRLLLTLMSPDGEDTRFYYEHRISPYSAIGNMPFIKRDRPYNIHEN